MKKHARKSDAEKYGKMKNIEVKNGAKSRQKPSKNEVWKIVDFWINFSRFFRVAGRIFSFFWGPIFTLIYLR